MTIREAVYQIFDEFYEYVCEYDSIGSKVITWLIENKTDYSFERYDIDVIAYDKDNTILKKETVYINYIPAKGKRIVSYILPDNTCHIEMNINDYSVQNLNKCNKEEHITDLYRADVLSYREYRDIHEYLFAEADDCINQKFLQLSVFERKIAVIKYFNARGVFSDKEIGKIIKCLENKDEK